MNEELKHLTNEEIYNLIKADKLTLEEFETYMDYENEQTIRFYEDDLYFERSNYS